MTPLLATHWWAEYRKGLETQCAATSTPRFDHDNENHANRHYFSSDEARIKSKLGHMTEYNTMGCELFTGDDS
ncbi:hypothetical protein TELCIR_04340 [Teladorsagia circumcincta]|uniref:Uncharacterized protein n=1 Tax=Teladorsagia circumcincta TaxID=45464 RepID=A0A2G9UU51_TELCI|nr:hypothetical protein TELCIR_04340 [Teladorsagia circumcincta]